MSSYVVPLSLSIAVLWGVQPIVHKQLMCKHRIDPKAVLVVGGMAYTACLLVFWMYFHRDVQSEVRRLPLSAIVIIAFLSIFTAFVANVVYLYVLRNNETYVVTALMYTSPVFTLVLAVLILREEVTLLGGLGAVLILAGVACLAKGA